MGGTWDGSTIYLPEQDTWEHAYSIVLRRTFAVFAESVYLELGGTKSLKQAELWEQHINGWLSDMEALVPGLVDDLQNVTLSDVLGQIEQGLSEGLTDDEIRERLGPTLDRMAKVRADRFAATETRWARNFGEHAGAEQAEVDTGQPKTKTWNWSFVSRREHAEINGSTIGLREFFDVPLSKGGSAPALYPHDMNLPAEARIHCGCYCTYA